MLKNFRYEIIIISALLVNLFFLNNLDTIFLEYLINSSKDFQQIFLKKFFESTTIIGDSLWYFCICLFLILVFLFLKITKLFNRNKNLFNLINYYNFLLLLSVLISGIFTQIIKHIVGRPRPSVADPESEYHLNFLTTDSHFHSFPSGHASTIFAVALVFSLVMPRLKYFFYLLAIMVSISRVVVGAHFISDIIGGAVVAFIGFKLSKIILSNFFKINSDQGLAFLSNNLISVVVLLFFISLFLAVGSSFDIYFSNMFYFGNNQFLIQSYYIVTIFFRKIVLALILVYILILPIISLLVPVQQLYFGQYFNFQKIIFIWSAMSLSLIGIINVFLKNVWGRARPNEILELGGENYFTSWYEISDQCSSNCSFVSGDAAVGFSLIIFYFFTKKDIYIWLSLFFGFAIGFIRIMEGGHFLSDVIFSGLVVFLLNIFFYLYYSKKFNG